MDYAGGTSTAGGKLKSTNGWIYYNDATTGTDDYGFAALPGGGHEAGGNFDNAGYNGRWWSSTEHESGAYYAWVWSMSSSFVIVSKFYADKTGLYSVRCVQD